ncbi:Sec63 Brl domain-containing protein [Calycina marina]|uniref:DNA 3'-5' helicase n=1 Tax=Calycina marina TaxID=1763456 RepID=A0A9P8CGC8_9HELO|nr:Sec63 Brl domain-containing protein [Calycina marina]
MAQGIQLVSPHELPDRLRQVFPYQLFNSAQSKCFAALYQSTDNMVVSAPTGCGKTAMLELAICKLVKDHKSGEFKIVYQAPTKSLCSERMRDWEKKFSHLNLACAELTGDTSYQEMNSVRNASIIITTPEKWDSITRKWKDHQKLIQMVKLFLIDEVHILKDMRGATLEAVVSRMKGCNPDIRFVALSATVPNSEDIAMWLGKNGSEPQLPAHRQTFGEEFRPVKLQKHVHGFDGQSNDFIFERILDGKIASLIHKYTQKKPIMVFCLTRKSCEGTAAILAEWWNRQRVVDRAWPAPTERIRVDRKDLQDMVASGVSFHHAGLDSQDRLAVESAYLKGNISVICCTSTLAVGVNLPCHLVVLKGTVGYQGGGGRPTEYSDLEVMQMLGRAGRPQFDDSAVAIIMTRKDKVVKYEKMMSGQDVLESTLHLNLIEHLNSEVGLGTIKDLYTAERWLAGTFLSVRMRMNPDYYNLDGVQPGGDTDQQLRLVCERDLKLLQDFQLVSPDQTFSCTEYGNAMSRYMVSFETMKLLLSLPKFSKTEEILQLICQGSELQDLRLKANEKKVLAEINKSPFIKFPIKGSITTTPQKISLIIQAQLGGVDFPDIKNASNIKKQFATEKCVVFERVQRLVRCVADCHAYDRDAISTRHALGLARSIAAEYWESSNLQLRQITSIGPQTNRKLDSKGISSVEKFASLDTAAIERLMGRNPPYGRKMLDIVVGFPLLTITAEVQGILKLSSGQNPKVKLKVCLGYSNNKIPVWNKKRPSLTLMAETSDGTLVYYWRGNISKLEKGLDIRFIVELCGPGDEVTFQIACDEIVGTVQSCKVKPDVPESAFPSPKSVQRSPKSAEATGATHQKEADEFGGEDFSEKELIEAVKDADATTDYGSDTFVDLDEIKIAPSSTESKKPPTAETLDSYQMANGRWSCNHACQGGNLRKNGQVCKHKCCAEGLDKPRKLKKRVFIVQSTRKLCRSQPLPSCKKSHGCLVKREDIDDTETINLADSHLPVPYSNLAPRKYRKLHNLHTKVQEDKNVRVSQQKPRFEYASGKKADLTFMKDSHLDDDDDPFGTIEDDLPPLDSLIGKQHRAANGLKPCEDGLPIGNNATSMENESASIDAAMMELDDNMITSLRKSPMPQLDESFENRLFDFEAFDDGSHKKDTNDEGFSSPLLQHTLARSQSPQQVSRRRRSVTNPPLPMKRPRSPSPIAASEVKCRRLTKEEREVKAEAIQEEPIKLEVATTQEAEKPPYPSWVSEMDQEFIESLSGIVTFVD